MFDWLTNLGPAIAGTFRGGAPPAPTAASMSTLMGGGVSPQIARAAGTPQDMGQYLNHLMPWRAQFGDYLKSPAGMGFGRLATGMAGQVSAASGNPIGAMLGGIGSAYFGPDKQGQAVLNQSSDEQWRQSMQQMLQAMMMGQPHGGGGQVPQFSGEIPPMGSYFQQPSVASMAPISPTSYSNGGGRGGYNVPPGPPSYTRPFLPFP